MIVEVGEEVAGVTKVDMEEVGETSQDMVLKVDGKIKVATVQMEPGDLMDKTDQMEAGVQTDQMETGVQMGRMVPMVLMDLTTDQMDQIMDRME
jgi:hypothetical protein